MSEPTSVINTNEKNASFKSSPSGILLGTKSLITAAISDCPVTDPGSAVKVRLFYYFFVGLFGLVFLFVLFINESSEVLIFLINRFMST